MRPRDTFFIKKLGKIDFLTAWTLAILALGIGPAAIRAEMPAPSAGTSPYRIERQEVVRPEPTSWVAQPAGFVSFGSGREVIVAARSYPSSTGGGYEAPSEVTGAASLGNFLFLGVRDVGLVTLDASGGSDPILSSSIPLEGSRFLPGADGTTVAVLAEGVGLYRFRILTVHHGDPFDGVPSEFLPLTEQASSLAVVDSRAFVAMRNGGVVVVDLPSGGQPILAGSLATPEPLLALARSGDALLAQGTSGSFWAFYPVGGTFEPLATAGLPPSDSLLAAGRALYLAGPEGLQLFSAGRQEATTITVKVGNIFFNPQTVTVAPGDTINWQWVGGTHSTTSGSCTGAGCAPDGTWDSGNKSGGTFDHTFGSAGTFPYYCKIHGDSMTGTVTVQGSQCTLSCTAGASPTSGTAPLAVAFNATGDAQHCDGIIAYAWDFGDGATASTQAASHTYATGGSFSWTMTATIQDQVCTKTGTITVTQPPVCSLTCQATAGPSTGVAPLTVGFAGSATATNCTGVPTYAWTFGDGATASSQNVDHTYDEAGTYSWTLTVTADGKNCSQSGTVTADAPCTLNCTATALPTVGLAPLTVAFSATSQQTFCPEFPTLLWEFGDGTTSTIPITTHTYTQVGTYAWTLTATAAGVTCVRIGEVSAVGQFPGDCDGNAGISIGEVQQAINMFLGLQAAGCGVDCSGDGTVSIGEVQKVINGFLGLPASC